MCIAVVFDWVLTSSSPVSSQDFYSVNGLVTGCDSSIGSYCYSPVYFISRSYIFFPATIITTM